MGAALLGKGLAPKSQSILFFGFSQVAIDLEPAVKMLVGYPGSLHTVTHNPLGMIITVALCGVIWSWSQKQSWWGQGMPVLSKASLWDTAWWAVLTHFLLDLMSHEDMGYGVAKWFGMEDTEGTSIMLGVLGLLLLGIRWLVLKAIACVQAILPVGVRFFGGANADVGYDTQQTKAPIETRVPTVDQR